MADPISHEAPARKGQDLPVMLPGKLIGRDVTLARVYAQLKENKPALVFGASGIGKTALAATLATAYTELPGGVLWLPVENTSFAELLVRVGRAYSLTDVTTTDNPAALVGLVATTLAQKKPLIVLDGKPNAATVTEFISRCADRLPVLIVGDEEMSGGWTNFRLAKLEPEQAAMLYRQFADPSVPLDGLNALAGTLDYTPFALAVAAGISYLTRQTPAQFLQSLPPQGQGASGGITPQLLALTAAFKSLTGALPGLILVMGSTLRGEASADLISLIANAPVDAIQTHMNLLAQYRLVERFERYGRPYYRLHPITHLFAQSWLRGSGRLETLQGKFRDSVLLYARQFSARQREGYDHLAVEMSNISATAQRAAELGDTDTVNALIVALSQAGDFVNARGYVYDLLMLRRLATSSSGAFPAHVDTPIPAPTIVSASPSPAAPALDTLGDDEEELADSVAFENGNPVEDEPEADADTGTNDNAEGGSPSRNVSLVSAAVEQDDDEEAEADGTLASVTDTLSMFETDEPLGVSLDAPLDEDFEDEDADDLDALDLLDDDSEDDALDEDAEGDETPDEADVDEDNVDEDNVDEDDVDEDDVDEDDVDDQPADEIARLRAQVVQARQAGDRRKQADLLILLGGELISEGK